MSAAGAAAERFDLASLPAQPWKNGGGLTREIAAHPPGAGFDDFAWRLSVADVERDGPFSAFPGVDRTLVLLRGAGMRLLDASGNAVVVERPGAAFAFPGETAIAARLIDGPTRDFNVMTRRGHWRADVAALRAGTSIAAADATLLLSGAGRWQVGMSDAEHTLASGQMLLWRGPAGPLQVHPAAATDASWLLAVRLCQHRP